MRHHDAGARMVCSPSVSSLGQGAVFGCSLYASGRATEGSAASTTSSKSRPGAGDDLFLAATGSGTIAVVSSSGACVDLNNPSYHGQGDGIIGFDADPRSGICVTGTFSGGVNVLSINYKEYHSLDSTPVRTLRRMLARRGTNAAGCIEKSDIVRRVKAVGACPVIRQEAALPAHGGTVVGVSISGSLVATGSNDGTVRLVRLDESILNRFGDAPPGGAAGGESSSSTSAGAGAGAGAKAAAPAGKRATIVRTIEPAAPAAGAEAAAIDSVYLHGDVLYTGDKASDLCRYDIETGALIRKWDTGHGWVWCICPTETTYREFEDPPQDCRLVLTGGTDGVVRVWDSRVANDCTHTEALTFGLDRVISRPCASLRLSGGTRGSPIAGMQACWSRNTVYAGSFDGNMHVLDIRAPRMCVPSIAEQWWSSNETV